MIWAPEHFSPYVLIHSCWMFCWNVDPAPESAPLEQLMLAALAELVPEELVEELSLPQAVAVTRLAVANPKSAVRIKVMKANVRPSSDRIAE